MALTERQQYALDLATLRLDDYAAAYGVPAPSVRFQPWRQAEFPGTRAHYEWKGVRNARPDHCITFFSVERILDDDKREETLAHEFLHHLEALEVEQAIAAGSTTRAAMAAHWTAERIEVGPRGGRYRVGDSHGRHHPAFYAKLRAMLAAMAASA